MSFLFLTQHVQGTQDWFKIKGPPTLAQNIHGVSSHLDWHPSSNAVKSQLWICPFPWCSAHFWNLLMTILEGSRYVYVLDCQMSFCFQHIWQKNLATLSVQSLIPSRAGINWLPLLFVLVLIQDSNIRRKFLFQVYFQHCIVWSTGKDIYKSLIVHILTYS